MTSGRKILLYEASGFGALLMLLWADELIDLPHVLFGSAATPTNHAELLLESVLVVVLGAIVLLATARLLGRLHHLEGLLHVCGSCRKVRDRGGWVSLEAYVEAHSDAELRHSYCTACALADLGYGSPRSEDAGEPR